MRAHDDQDWLARRFEEHRPRLRAVAYRMLGSTAEADDAVQEAWLRLSRANSDAVENLGGWLTTVVARWCLHILQARNVRRETAFDDHADPAVPPEHGADPEHEALLADATGPALLVVLETVEPAERLTFVLHDMFAVPFAEIAPIVGRSPTAARQLASRTRRRVQGSAPGTGSDGHREIVEAFLTASRGGDFTALLTLLDPDVVLRADAAAVRMDAQPEVRGPAAVAETFSGRAQGARIALIDGAPGAVWSVGGRPRVVFDFTVAGDKVVAIDLLADPEDLAMLDLALN